MVLAAIAGRIDGGIFGSQALVYQPQHSSLSHIVASHFRSFLSVIHNKVQARMEIYSANQPMAI